ncbi:MAG: hypothetical protein ACKV2T_08120 [Kofleriaceae bacterium]
MKNQNDQLTFATISKDALATIDGAGVGGLISKGYRAVRPVLKEAADFVKDTAIVMGGALGAYHWFGGDRSDQPSTQPSSNAPTSSVPNRPFGH